MVSTPSIRKTSTVRRVYLVQARRAAVSNQNNDEQRSANEEYLLSKHYGRLPQAEPSEALDSAILLKAKAAAKTNRQANALSKAWRPRSYYSGFIAASLLLVVVVFVPTGPELERKEATQQNSRVDLAQAPLETQELMRIPAQEIEIHSRTMQDAETDVDSANTDLDTLHSHNAHNAHSSGQAEAHSAEALSQADILLSRLLELKALQMHPASPKNLAQAKRQEAEMSLPRDKRLGYLDNAIEFTKLQQQLFQLLMKQKQNAQVWELDKKYEGVLMPEQIELLRQPLKTRVDMN